MKLDVENDEQHSEEAPPNTHLHELARIGHNRRIEQERLGHFDEAFAEGHVLQNRLIGKPAQLLEQGSSNEERLITINDTTAGASEVVQE